MLTEQLQQRLEAAYGLRIVEAELLRNLDAQVYRIVDAGGEQFLLKDMRDGDAQRAAATQAVAALLHALRQQTSLVVPTIHLSQNREALVEYQTNDGEVRLLLIYTWVDGIRASTQEPTPALTYQMGQVAGWMHRCAVGLTERFAIRVYDQAYLHHLGTETICHWPGEIEDQRAEVQAAVERLAEQIAAIGYDATHFGLIHADFHFGNLLITPQGAIGVIDFDEIAYGHYLFDLTNMIVEFADYDELGPALEEAFVRGYLDVRPEMAAPFAELPWFLALSALVFVHWVFTAPGEQVKRTKLTYVPGALAELVTVGL
jgi:Ser/Thr protein kinase RdoA (MazF antagonist)